MEKFKEIVNCGSFYINYTFLFEKTKDLFFGYILDGFGEKRNLSENHGNNVNCDIQLDAAYLERTCWLVDENEPSLPFREFQSLMLATGNTLLQYSRALFHGAALLWKGKAWILTAPSGTGKTTQLRHWRRILKKEVQIINGDKPLLECREDGSIWVHSSPWRGKEKYGTPGLSAPLGGIIFLQQGQENRMERMNVEETVRPLFTEFVSYPETKAQILCQSDILSRILDVTPVWKLVNLGDIASAERTLQVLSEFLENREETCNTCMESREESV